jgi:hypothetical protein
MLFIRFCMKPEPMTQQIAQEAMCSFTSGTSSGIGVHQSVVKNSISCVLTEDGSEHGGAARVRTLGFGVTRDQAYFPNIY